MNSSLVRSTRVLLVVLFLLATTNSAQDNFTVSAGSAGRLRVGMTVKEARGAMPGHTFVRTTDGDGVALIAVGKGDKTVLTLYAGEEDPDSIIKEDAIIEQIEVWGYSYKTIEGIGPGTTINDAEKKYGPVKEIMLSEIESREYVEFENNPKGIGFRIDYSGVFDAGKRITKRYRSGGKIMSVIISGDGSESNIGFFSDYTDLATACKTEKPDEEGSHVATYCEGPEGFRVHMYDTAMTLEITVESTVSRNIISIARESLNFKPQGKMLEWRFKNGEPFAVILRGNKYREDENGQIKYPAQVIGEYLFVRGLSGFESINADVNVRTTKFANDEARKIADEGYVRVKFPPRESLIIDTSDYNLMIIKAAAAGEKWVKSPMQVAARIAGEFSEMKTRKIVFEATSGEAADSFTLTIINDGLLDDSVRGEKFVYELSKEASGVWKVASAIKAWRCWPGRGHEEFSALPCF